MRSAGLAEVVDQIRAAVLGLHSLTVVRHGAIVLDARFFPYDGSRPQDVASVTKTLTGLAVGLAVDRGHLPGVGSPLAGLIDELTVVGDPDPRRDAITIEDALTMRAGLACDPAGGEATLQGMIASEDWVAYVADLPMADDPGTRFVYCSPVSHLLSALVSRHAPSPTDRWLGDQIFDAIGIGDVLWPADPQGIPQGWGDVRMEPRDMARVGLLLLHGGRWAGERLLSDRWIRRATRPHVDLGDGEGFGYHTWVDDELGFYASGRGGQFILVAPSLDMVVVTTGAAGDEQVEALSTTILGALVGAVGGWDPLPADPEGAAALGAGSPPPIGIGTATWPPTAVGATTARSS